MDSKTEQQLLKWFEEISDHECDGAIESDSDIEDAPSEHSVHANRNSRPTHAILLVNNDEQVSRAEGSDDDCNVNDNDIANVGRFSPHNDSNDGVATSQFKRPKTARKGEIDPVELEISLKRSLIGMRLSLLK
ncbi:hypothetical protein JTB14_018764 [Gonioctena quinquepunctata]|nr:hypothetical protein JTB14_018764 [Gonioctena quinquepunctata]